MSATQGRIIWETHDHILWGISLTCIFPLWDIYCVEYILSGNALDMSYLATEAINSARVRCVMFADSVLFISCSHISQTCGLVFRHKGSWTLWRIENSAYHLFFKFLLRMTTGDSSKIRITDSLLGNVRWIICRCVQSFIIGHPHGVNSRVLPICLLSL